MGYKCGVCGEIVEDGLTAFVGHTENHIVDIIKENHPEWGDDDGVCVKCLEYYRKQMKGESAE